MATVSKDLNAVDIAKQALSVPSRGTAPKHASFFFPCETPIQNEVTGCPGLFLEHYVGHESWGCWGLECEIVATV